MFFIIILTLKDEKVHFKWLYEENLELEMDFKALPHILASVHLQVYILYERNSICIVIPKSNAK